MTRPTGEARLHVLAALVELGGGTSRDVARRTGWALGVVRVALDNACRAGEVRKVGSVRVPGVCRPVPWYEAAPERVEVAQVRPFALPGAWWLPVRGDVGAVA